MPDSPAMQGRPLPGIPGWARRQRQLIDLLQASVEPFLERYVRNDRLIWRDTYPDTRDGADDFYEAAQNWPLLYLLTGNPQLLEHSQRLWDGITQQLTDLGVVHKEYEQGYDQFHQSESYIYFYFLCLADPSHERNRERARRFAGFYLNEDPEAPNYDPARRLIRAAHNGSRGPRYGYTDVDPPTYGYAPGMATYGLPFADLPDIDTYEDLREPEKALRMGRAMQERMGRGDVAGNLGVASLIANAFLLTGEDQYHAWITEYLSAWQERADANGGLIPDNVGLSGEVGEYLDGRWYGGLYGWTWPHGYYNIGQAAAVAGQAAALLTGDTTWLNLARGLYDSIMDLGEYRDPGREHMSLRDHWVDQLDSPGHKEKEFLVPYRHGDSGWFDWQPMGPMHPFALWNVSGSEEDLARIRRLQQAEKGDWYGVTSYRLKEDSGHEKPWLTFLDGLNPDYPDRILDAALEQVRIRLRMIEEDDADLTQVNIHHWQQHNPVTTEALVQLTLGAPQPLYNGGLLHAPVRHFDGESGLPGLPPDVAVLVTGRDENSISLMAVNTGEHRVQSLRIQAGAYGEHAFTGAMVHGTESRPWSDTNIAGDWPERCVTVALEPGYAIRLTLGLERFRHTPAC